MRGPWLAAGLVAAAAGLTSGCFALLLAGNAIPSPRGSDDKTTQTLGDKTTLTGSLSVPSNLTSVEPLNTVQPLTSADPLTVLTPLVGNAGAGLAGNAGATLIGNAGAGLAGNAGATLAGPRIESLVPASAFYRLLMGTLPSLLPAPAVEAVDPASGEVVGSGQASGTSYSIEVSAGHLGKGLIVQALFRKDGDVLAFLAGPVTPTSTGATADLSLGTTLATFTAARLAGVGEADLKLDSGFKGLQNRNLSELAGATKADQTDLAAASNLSVTSTEFKKILSTAGSLSRAVADTAREKAAEARSSGETAQASASVEIAAALTVINKVAEVVDAEGTLGKAMDRAAEDVQGSDVARRAEGKEATASVAPKLEEVSSPEDLAPEVDRVRGSLACAAGQFYLAWQAGGRQARAPYRTGAPPAVVQVDGQAPLLTAVASNLLVFSRRTDGFGSALLDASASTTQGRTFDPQEGFDLFAGAGGLSTALLAYDGPGRVTGLLLSASPSLLTDLSLAKTAKLPLSDSAALGAAARGGRRPAVVALGDAYLVVWDEAEGTGRRIVGRFVGPDGKPVKEDPVRIYPPRPDGRMRGHAAVSVGTRGFLVAWTEEREGFADIAAIRLNFDGTLAEKAFDVSDALFDQRNPTVTWTGTRFVVAWDDRRSAEHRTVGARLVAPDAELGEELILDAGTYNELPAIASCGGNVALGWLDGAGGKSKFRGLRARIVQ